MRALLSSALNQTSLYSITDRCIGTRSLARAPMNHYTNSFHLALSLSLSLSLHHSGPNHLPRISRCAAGTSLTFSLEEEVWLEREKTPGARGDQWFLPETKWGQRSHARSNNTMTRHLLQCDDDHWIAPGKKKKSQISILGQPKIALERAKEISNLCFECTLFADLLRMSSLWCDWLELSMPVIGRKLFFCGPVCPNILFLTFFFPCMLCYVPLLPEDKWVGAGEDRPPIFANYNLFLFPLFSFFVLLK